MAVNKFLAVGTLWNVGANWSLGTVPTNADQVEFDAVSNDCTLDINAVADSIDMTGYTNTLDQSTFDLTVDLAFTCPAGTFTGGSGTLTVSGVFTLNGGTFTAPSGVFISNSTFTISSGTFNHNSGKVSWGQGTQTITTNGTSFNDVDLVKSGAGNRVTTLVDGFTILGNLFVDNSGSNSLTVNASVPLVVNLKGNLSVLATGGSGFTNFGNSNLSLEINGSGTQTMTHGLGNAHLIAHYKINSTGTVQFATDFSFTGSLTYTAGTWAQNGFDAIFDFASNSIPIITSNGLEFDNLSFIKTAGGNRSVTIADDMIVNGNLVHTTSGINDCKVNPSGTRIINLKGNFTMQETAGNLVFGSSSLSLNFTGTNEQKISLISGNMSSNIIIDKASGTVRPLIDFVMSSLTADFIVELGTFDTDGFDFTVADTLVINGGTFIAGSATVLTDGINSSGGTFLGDSSSITVTGTFDLNGGTFESTTGLFRADKEFTITSGTFNHNNGTVGWGNEFNQNITTNGVTFNNIDFLKASGGTTVITLIDDFTILGNLTVDKTDADSLTISPSGTRVINLEGDFSLANTSGANSMTFGNANLTLSMAGASDQNISRTGGNFNADMTVRKPSGSVIQITDFVLVNDLILFQGILCTNEFDLNAENIVINDTVSELQKTPSSTVTSVNPIVGTVTDVSECGKKNSILALL